MSTDFDGQQLVAEMVRYIGSDCELMSRFREARRRIEGVDLGEDPTLAHPVAAELQVVVVEISKILFDRFPNSTAYEQHRAIGEITTRLSV